MTVVYYLFDTYIVMNRWDDDIIIMCDEPRLDIPITDKTDFYLCSFTPFKKTILEVYLQFVQKIIFPSK